MAAMHLSNTLIFLLAGHVVNGTASTTTNDHADTYFSPTSTHPFEVLSTTIYVDSVEPRTHNNNEGKLSPRSVCGRGIPVLAVQCPDDASCDLKPECICPECCPKNHECTGCPKVSVIMDAAGKLHTTCIAAETVFVVTGKGREVVPRTLGFPEASMTANSSSLTETMSPLAMSESLPAPTTSNQQGQAALQRGVVQPFAWLSRLVSSLSIRLAQALPIKMRESSAAGRVYGSSLQSESAPSTGSHSAVETPAASSSKTGHFHRERSIGDDKNKHQHFHRHRAARKLNGTSVTNTTTSSGSGINSSSRNVLPVSWFTTTTTSTTTVFSTQAAAEPTKTCDLRRRRAL